MLKHKQIALLSLAVVLTGCSGSRVASQVAAANDSNIKRAANLINAYQTTHGWQGPKDEKTLRAFINDRGIPDENLRMMGIDSQNLDSVFKSDRDGKPFKIRYGVS